MRLSMIGIALALYAGGAHAQTLPPYAGLQDRPIKALSAQQIDDLRAGRGMSMALAAELNGYPGPRHALELASSLALNADQRDRITALTADMTAEAAALGERLIAQEQQLDRQFADRTVTDASLSAATDAIGRTQAQLRAAHLRYHLLTADLLTQDQRQRYAGLRGYGTQAPSHSGGHSHR